MTMQEVQQAFHFLWLWLLLTPRSSSSSSCPSAWPAGGSSGHAQWDASGPPALRKVHTLYSFQINSTTVLMLALPSWHGATWLLRKQMSQTAFHKTFEASADIKGKNQIGRAYKRHCEMDQVVLIEMKKRQRTQSECFAAGKVRASPAGCKVIVSAQALFSCANWAAFTLQ